MNVQHISGYVAFLDVLGFSDLISRDDSLELVQDYTHAIQKAVSGASREAELRFVLFSDSIIISTHSGNESAFTSLLAACSRIFGALVALEVPVRGAIAYGSFIRSDEGEAGTIVAGRPINEAYSWERRQDWVGISLAPSVLRHIPDLHERCATRPIDSQRNCDDFHARLPWVAHLVYYDEIPFHLDRASDPRTGAGFAVVPLDDAVHTVDDIWHCAERLQLHANRMRVVGPDPASQRKCTELRLFLEHVVTRWGKILNSRWSQEHFGDIVERRLTATGADGARD